MNCPMCNSGTLEDGKYICKVDGYHIADLDNNVLFHVREDNIESGDVEIDDTSDVEYCPNIRPGLNFCTYWKFK